jgi:hypothetical protein
MNTEGMIRENSRGENSGERKSEGPADAFVGGPSFF